MIRVTAEDLETGESSSIMFDDTYVLTTAGRCYLAHEQRFANGTTILTIKTESKDGGSR